MRQTSRALEPFDALRGKPAPAGGWLRAVREALGLTVRGQAARAGISYATLHASEKAESQERISLGQLRKLANALDCELVYAIVPRQPLEHVIQAQVAKVAQREVGAVAHTMGLEEQRPSDEYLTLALRAAQTRLLAGRWSRLWS